MRMANFCSIKYFFNFVLFAQKFFIGSNIKVSALTNNAGKEQCIGKYQLHFDKAVFAWDSQMLIKFHNLDQIPTESSLQNNGHILKIELYYDVYVPTIKVNITSLGVVGVFRLKFMYFHWLKLAPHTLSYNNKTFPAQLHAVFYDVNAKSYDHAVALSKSIIGLAFHIEVNSIQDSIFNGLEKDLKYVLKPNSKTSMKNINLDYWTKSIQEKYSAYEGSLLEFPCQGTVIWIDFHTALSIQSKTVDEFQKLRANEVGPLMGQITEFVKPKGKVFVKKESTDGARKHNPTMPGLIIGVLFIIFHLF